MESSAFIIGHHRNLIDSKLFISPYSYERFINSIYFIAQKIFLFDILEAVLAYDLVKIRFTKEKEVILNGNVNDKSNVVQLIGPGWLQRVLNGVTDCFLLFDECI